MCDRLYFEEISYESVIDVYQREKPKVFSFYYFINRGMREMRFTLIAVMF